MRRLLPLTLGALALAACGSHAAGTASTAAARTTAAVAKPGPTTPAQRILGLPPVRPGPVPGYLLIADRNNGRILVVSPAKRVVWRFTGLRDPDDAFFTPGYRDISINEEYDQTMSLIALRRHKVLWTYGHPGVRGSAPGYLSNPDDAYLLPSGLVMVADIQNCRVLFVDRAKRVVREIGHAGACGHDPPRGLSSPNGATPLPDGGVLVTEIGGWVDRISKTGRLVYTLRTPTTYPSDAQLLPDGDILVAGFNTPGRVDELTPSGRIVWTFAPTGYWSLDRPSLAVRWPNGMIAITDDWHHRVLVVDPRTKRVVWSYGHLDAPGSAAGYLNKPDGLDLLPGVAAPVSRASTNLSKTAMTRGQTRVRPDPARRGANPHPASRSASPSGTTATRDAPNRGQTRVRPRITRVGTLPQPLSRASAVALPGGRLLVLGGLAGGSSTDQVLLGPPARLRAVARLPVAGHDAAAALVGGRVYLFGGGQAVSTDAIVRLSATTGTATAAGRLDEPLSDLGAAVVAGRTYLVGGYTGSRYATAVLRYDGKGKTTVAARLPTGLRYSGVAALDGRIYVAGGLATSGETDAVYAVDPGTGTVRRVGTLPAPTAYGALAAAGGALYLVGGKSASGAPSAEILRIDPRTGATAVAARLPKPLAEPAAVSLGGSIVVVGGEGSDAVYVLRL